VIDVLTKRHLLNSILKLSPMPAITLPIYHCCDILKAQAFLHYLANQSFRSFLHGGQLKLQRNKCQALFAALISAPQDALPAFAVEYFSFISTITS
jgi:hypothetical protein